MAAGTAQRTNKPRTPGRPRAGTLHPLLQMGPVFAARDKWRVVMGRDTVYINITPEIIAKAKPRSPNTCVVALSLAALFGKRYDFQVGSGITKIWDFKEKIELRLHTPSTLSKALRTFDKTGEWGLPANLYRLGPMLPILKNHERSNKKHKEAAKRLKAGLVAVRKPTKRAAPTRTVIRNSRINWHGAELL